MDALKRLYLKYRMRVGLALVTVVVLHASLNLLYRRVVIHYHVSTDHWLAFHEQRYDRIRGIVSSYPAVGYVSAVDYETAVAAERSFRDVEMLAQYYIVQYTLAPTLVYYSPHYPLVIGNFLRGSPDQRVLAENRLVPIASFGDGLILFKNVK